jgi:RNA polymerase sigma factor (sigma-70 family)
VSLPDSDLIAKVVANDDHHAYGELVQRHQSPVRGMLRKLTNGDDALADDLAQQSFIKAYRSLRNYRGEGQFTTWLYRIAYNQFKTELSRRRTFESNDNLESIAAPVEQAEGFSVDLQHALVFLSQDERSAVVLCLINGCTHEEASEILSLPLGTVKTHVLRGREKLKERLIAWKPN